MMKIEDLKLEVNKKGLSTKPEDTGVIPTPAGAITVTPKVGEDWWLFRVKVSKDQAILGFPKHMTIGIGFSKEDSNWNKNLPYCTPEGVDGLYRHIEENKGDDNISRKVCIVAIEMIKTAVEETRSLWDMRRRA